MPLFSGFAFHLRIIQLQRCLARTQDKAGKILPVVITYYTDKSFDFVVKTPPVAVQLKEVAKVKAGSKEPNRTKVAEISWEQVRAIAEDKMPDLNCFLLRLRVPLANNPAPAVSCGRKYAQPL